MIDFDDIKKTAENLRNKVINHRRKLHSLAECGFELERTVEYVTCVLDDIGIVYSKCGRSGIVCSLGEGITSFMLRADMDALPMIEESDEEFAAGNGNAHTCGHDMHTAMLLGAIELLFNIKDKIQGRIVFCFQPAEEILSGATDMIDNGLLNLYGVEGAFAIHVLSGVEMETGSFILSTANPAARESVFFDINVKGFGSHGALPHLSSNALACGMKIVELIDGIPARNFSFTDGVTLSIGKFESGTAPNVIADNASVKGTLRAFDSKVTDATLERIKEIIKNISSIFGCSSDFKVTARCLSLTNNKEMSDYICALLQKMYGENMILVSNKRGDGGSEDFANISRKVPSVMISLVAGCKKDGYIYPLHHPKVRFDERALKYGVVLFSCIGLYFAEKFEKTKKFPKPIDNY